MQILDPNNVKIYNLTSGKSIPEWLSDRKKRLLLKKKVDLRRRIELIQDFQMPAVSSCIRLSPDAQYIVATGIYKPRVRCFDVSNLAMKFERGFDSEVVSFEILSEDYSKMVFLQCDRYIEFHSAEGRYYRMRMPRFGHDLKYHPHTSDLYLVGVSSDIYRFNLERGQFLPSFLSTQTTEINKVTVNPIHGLVITGGTGGKVEAWDPRVGICVGTLDCALSIMMSKESITDQLPDITALNFNGNLTYGVGMSTGHVLLYDIRTNKPYRVKDHMYQLPIIDIEFTNENVLSMDSTILKIWNEETGNLFTSIDAGSTTQFNNLCLVPHSGMFFIANENAKILTYYIPNLGPAPRWCGFLDALTEELEETSMETIYDDYKFVTEKELEDLELSHLIGTDLLRGYMHGYFMDIRLYRKAKSAIEPFDYAKYKNKIIKETLDREKTKRIQIQKKLPVVNKELAVKLLEDKDKRNKRAKGAANLLEDDRFKSLFQNPDFEVDPNSEEYRHLMPAMQRLESRPEKEEEKNIEITAFPWEEDEKIRDSEESNDDVMDEKRKFNHKMNTMIGKNKYMKRKMASERKPSNSKRTKFYELNSGQEMKLFSSGKVEDLQTARKPLGERVKESTEDAVKILSSGNRAFTFIPSESKKNDKKWMDKQEKHKKERKKLIRPVPREMMKLR